METNTSGAHSSESLDIIDSPEKLQEYLKGGEGEEVAPSGKKKASGTDNKPTAKSAKEDAEGDPLAGEGFEEEEEIEGKGKKKPEKKVEKKGGLENIEDPGNEEEEEEEEEEFSNAVDYLNKEFDLGLNMAALPENMTREEEADAIANIFRRVDQGVKQKLSEFAAIVELLKDKEVAMVIEGKKSGKSLKDIFSTIAPISTTAPDDVVVTRHLKKTMPGLSDAEIAEQVALYREKGKLEKIATSAREAFKTEETEQEKAVEKKKVEDAAREEQAYLADVEEFKGFLKNTQKVYGVPVSPEMKKRVFQAVTVRDAEGLTYHDRVLRSNEGSFLSALGIMYMKDLLRKGTAGRASKVKDDFANRLFDSPDALRSSSEAAAEPEFDASIANRF